MVFPQTPLQVQIRLKLAGVWTDITSDVYTENKIVIERGRPDEATRTDPGKCSLVLNNRLGKYSRKNPLSPYYGQLTRNTEIQVSVLGVGSTYLESTGNVADFASTPDTAVLDITGDLDLRIEAEADWYAIGAQSLIGKWEASGNQKAYMLRLENGSLVLHHSTDGLSGGAFAQQLPMLPRRAALRATLDIDNGAGGRTVRFYWARSIAGPWTEFGTPQTLAGTTATFVSTAPLKVAPADTTVTIQRFPFVGKAFKAEVRSGIGGTLVANPDFTAQASGTTSFADSAGRTWTLAGAAAITDRKVRFHGEVSNWPTRWDVSGKDIRTPIEAAGVLRRYGQGQKPFDSTLRRRIPSFGPSAYWPMEEAQGATQAYSPVSGVRPMTVTGVTFGADDSLGGATTVPAFDTDGWARGAVPTIPAGAWRVEFVMKLDAMPSSLNTMLEVTTTGTAKKYTVRVQTNNVEVRALDGDGAQLALINITAPDFLGRWNRFILSAEQVGADVDVHVAWLGVGTNGVGANTTYTATEGRPTAVRVLGVPGNLRAGHVAVFPDDDSTAFSAADDGFAGETATARLRRLAAEEGKPISVFGTWGEGTLMGPQRPQTFLDLVDETAETDGGILYERRDRLALAYRERLSLYNQAPALELDYQAPGLADPLDPADDDQAIRNDVTVERVGGTSARAVLEEGPLSVQAPPNGVGLYDESLTLNLYTDDQPASHAGWRLHLGTSDEDRYPVVSVDLAAAPNLIEAATQLDCGDRLTIANPPPHLPPGTIDLLMQGQTEIIGHPIDWDMQLNCTPAAPWDVAWAGSATTAGHAREFQWVDGDFLTLAAALNTTATTASVITTTGPVWWGAVADTPYDWRISGEVVTVTAPGSLVNANPFFDTSTTGWTTQNCTIGRSTAVVMPHPKAKASLLITPDGVSASGGANGTLTAVASVTPGAPYMASMWAYSPGGHADLRPCIDWYDAAGGFLSTGLGSGTAVPAGVWTYIEQSLTAPASASRAIVRARHGGTPAASAVYYTWAVRITRPTASWLKDTFGRTVASSWGTSDTGLIWNTVGGGAASDYAVGSGYAAHVLSTLDTTRRTAITAIHPDADIYCDLTTSQLATGTESLYGAVTARMLDANNMYMLRCQFTTSNTILLTIRKLVAGVQTQLGSSYTVPATHVAGTFVRVRFQLQGSALRAKAWPVTGVEPSAWAIETTDSDITAANQIGTRSVKPTGSTNGATVEMRYDNFEVINPQQFTVARSVNGIVKALPAAAPVRLAYPAVVAL